MTAYLCPILFALFVWWFSTGAIIYLDGLPTRTFKWSMMGATALFAAALYGLWLSADDTTVNGAYIAFASVLLAWGWHEISFYMGYVTGPRKHACRDGCKGWAHFGHALMASLWHELAIIVSFVVILALTQGGQARTGHRRLEHARDVRGGLPVPDQDQSHAESLGFCSPRGAVGTR